MDVNALVLPAGVVLTAGGLGVAAFTLLRRPAEPTGVAKSVAAIRTAYSAFTPAPAAAAAGPEQVPRVLRFGAWLTCRILPGDARSRAETRLVAAGQPPGWSAERVLGYQGLAPIFCALLFAFYGQGGGAGRAVLFAVIGAAAGFGVPELLLHNLALRRQEAIRTALPDMLDLLSVCVQAGLGFDAALARVGERITGPLGAELARVVQETRIGTSRDAALKALAERCPVNELQTFVTALAQASSLGLPIGTVLREQAKEIRLVRRQRAEEAAQKIPVKITFPVTLCILPALFIVVLGPGVLSLMSSSAFG